MSLAETVQAARLNCWQFHCGSMLICSQSSAIKIVCWVLVQSTANSRMYRLYIWLLAVDVLLYNTAESNCVKIIMKLNEIYIFLTLWIPYVNYEQITCYIQMCLELCLRKDRRRERAARGLRLGAVQLADSFVGIHLRYSMQTHCSLVWDRTITYLFPFLIKVLRFLVKFTFLYIYCTVL